MSVLAQERHGRGEHHDAVLALARAVALVRKNHELTRNPLALEGVVNLKGLSGRDARIAGALDDQKRRLHPVDVGHRRELRERVRVLVGVAVLADAEDSAVRRRVRNVRRSLMPTTSTPASYAPANIVIAISVEYPP